MFGKNFPVDLKRVGGYITNNKLWDRPLGQWSKDEIENFVRASVWITGTWPPAIRLIINWLKETELPEKPFVLKYTDGGHPLINVDNARTFQKQLLQDISFGPGGPKAYYGALQSDIRRVYEVFGQGSIDDEVPF